GGDDERIGRRRRGELYRVNLGVVRDGHRGRSAIVGEGRRIVGHVRARAPIGALRPLGSRAGPGAIDLRIYGARRQRGERGTRDARGQRPPARGGNPTRSAMLSRTSYVGTAEPQLFGTQ